MKRLYLLYALSGLVSLGYQVAWLRIYVDRFGSTSLTFVLVLCNFIAGLGLGALASRRVSEGLSRGLGIRDRLRVYGLVELLVTATALLTVAAAFIPADVLGAFPYRLKDGFYIQTPAYQALKLAVATGCVFVPCFFMGVTFPLLCFAFREDARFPSALYAWNTLGACTGVLLAEFVFIPKVGHDQMFLALVSVNLLIGLFFLGTGGAPNPTAAGSDAAPARDSVAEPMPGGVAHTPSAVGLGVLMTCAILSGLLAGSLEADMFKRIKFIGINTSSAMSFISFWAILGIFLASWTVRALPSLRLLHIKGAFVAALLIYVGVTSYAYPLHTWIFGGLGPDTAQQATQSHNLLFPPGLAPLLFYVGLLVFPAFLLISPLLPYVCNRIQGRGRHLGFAYGANTLAFCLGTVVFTWVTPQVNIFYSLKLAIVLLTVGVALLLFIREGQRLAVWKPLAAIGALVIGCVFTPTDFDRSYMTPHTAPTHRPIRAMRSDASSTTFVVSLDAGDLLYFENISLSNATLRSQIYMSLMAHFPLLAQENPKDALLICYGVGNTASAIASHETIERLDVVDLSLNVLKTAPEFRAVTNDVHLDPRLRYIHDDGRNFLNLTDRRYDLITSEPPPPLHMGVYRLYSQEYYERALEKLTPEGMMTQWLPVVQMPPKAVELAIRTFTAVFPHTLLVDGIDTDFILVGSAAPIRLERLVERFSESERVEKHLEGLGIHDPMGLLARVTHGDRALRRRYAGERTIRDARNDLDHLFLDPGEPGIIPFDPLELVEELDAVGLTDFEELRGITTHLGRLQYHVHGFPIASLETVEPEEGLSFADVDWAKIRRLEMRAMQMAQRGRRADARRLAREALELAPEQPGLLLRVATMEANLGDFDAAIDALDRFARIEPNDPIGPRRLAGLYERRGQPGAATAHYRRALALDPEHSHDAMRLAWILATHPEAAVRNGSEAVRWAEHSASLEEAATSETYATLAAAYAEAGDFDAATDWQRKALASAPTQQKDTHSSRLALYANHEPLRELADNGIVVR